MYSVLCSLFLCSAKFFLFPSLCLQLCEAELHQEPREVLEAHSRERRGLPEVVLRRWRMTVERAFSLKITSYFFLLSCCKCVFIVIHKPF